MKIQLGWLREHVDLPEPAEQTGRRLTSLGFALDGLEEHRPGDRPHRAVGEGPHRCGPTPPTEQADLADPRIGSHAAQHPFPAVLRGGDRLVGTVPNDVEQVGDVALADEHITGAHRAFDDGFGDLLEEGLRHPVEGRFAARLLCLLEVVPERHDFFSGIGAHLAVGVGHEDKVAFNRRVRMKDGLTFSHPGPGNPGIVGYAGPIDPQVGTVGVWDLRDNLLGYSPITLKLAQRVVAGTFRGTRFGEPAPKPAPAAAEKKE